jgi:SAM-dependent methyltransferase
MREWEFTTQGAYCRVCGDCNDQEKFWEEDYISNGQYLVHCGCCGFAYLYPFPTSKTLDYFYYSDYRKVYSFGSAKKHDERFLRDCLVDEIGLIRANMIFGEYQLPNNILEIGPGFGGFLAAIGSYGHEVSLYALEADPKCFPRLGKIAELVESIDSIYADSIEMACAFHVLEHVLDPSDLLQQLFKVMKNDGLVAFEVPNFLSNWGNWNSHVHGAHQSYFTIDSLKFLLTKNGFFPETIIEYKEGELLSGAILIVARKSDGRVDLGNWTYCTAQQTRSDRVRLKSKKPRFAERLKSKTRRLMLKLIGPEHIGGYQRRKFYKYHSRLIK